MEYFGFWIFTIEALEMLGALNQIMNIHLQY